MALPVRLLKLLPNFSLLPVVMWCRDIAKSLGLEDYQHDAATAVCVDYVSYALK